jgi:hypothetical protein
MCRIQYDLYTLIYFDGGHPELFCLAPPLASAKCYVSCSVISQKSKAAWSMKLFFNRFYFFFNSFNVGIVE